MESKPVIAGAVIGPSRVTDSGGVLLGLEAPMTVTAPDRQFIAHVFQQYELVQRARLLP